jgi:hypothetical protein
MPIYINKNGQQSGPYEDHIVRDQLTSGVLSPSTMGIRHGDATWQRLGDMFPDAVRKEEPSAAVRAAAPAVSPASEVVATPAAARGGCRGVAAILLMVLGAMALLGGAGLALATPFVYTTPSCDFAESDWKEIEELKKKYDAADDTYEKASVEVDLKTAMAGYETSAKHCADQKSTMRMFQIGEGGVAVVGLLMLIVGFVIRRL